MIKSPTITDSELIQTLHKKVKEERALNLSILHDLIEIEKRRLHLKRGYASLFTFLCKELSYSESEAYLRIQAMRAVKEVPEIEDKLSAGKLTLTTVAQVQSFYDRRKKQESRSSAYSHLGAAISKSSQEMSQSSPQESRKGLSSDKAPRTFPEKWELFQKIEGKSKREVEGTLASLDAVAASREGTRVLDSERVELKVQISRQAFEDLQRLKARFAHQLKNQTLGELLEKLVEKEQAKMEKKEAGSRAKAGGAPDFSQNSVPAHLMISSIETVLVPRNRHIPLPLRRAVWKRDGGKCTFRSRDSRRSCESDYALQIDHIVPYSRGGQHSLENLRLLCRAHHRLREEGKKEQVF